MPAFQQNLVINDGQATPVAHTFNPTTKQADGLCVWHDRVSGVAIGYPQISVKMRMPAAPVSGNASDASTRLYRQDYNLAWPTMEVTSPSTGTGIQPAPTVAYIHRVNSQWLSPERGTQANRKDVRAIFYNGLNHAAIKTFLEDLENFN
jgi:hypothetical protein